jgi:hypothetical protein
MAPSEATGSGAAPARYRALVVAVAVAVAAAFLAGRPIGQAALALCLLPVVLRPQRLDTGAGNAGAEWVVALLVGAVLAMSLLQPLLPGTWAGSVFFGLVVVLLLIQLGGVVLLVVLQVRGVPMGPDDPAPPPDSRPTRYGDADRALAAAMAGVLAAAPWFPPGDPRFWVPAALFVGAVPPVRVWRVTRIGAPLRR